jgi:hypothetical protein
MERASLNNEMQLLWGATAIAAALGLTRRQTFHLLESGAIPARKVGGRWVAERTVLHQYFADSDVQR